MTDNIDLPISLRRTRRSASRLSDQYKYTDKTDPMLDVAMHGHGPTGKSTARIAEPLTRTPSQRRHNTGTTKRVRFSDPGPVLTAETGLTPMIRRTSLAGKRTTSSPSSPSSSRRRHSMPLHNRRSTSSSSSTSADDSAGTPRSLDSSSMPMGGEVTFLSLRQVLDGRVKRRIRRNGLSEEMNIIHAEKKERKRLLAKATQTELEQLRDSLAKKDQEIQQLQHLRQAENEGENGDDTIIQDSGRIFDLELQVSRLRRELAAHSADNVLPPTTPDTTTPSRCYNWTLAARDPFASTIDAGDSTDMVDASSLAQDELFGDATMAELQSSTPSRAGRRGMPTREGCSAPDSFSFGESSFPTPPATSPVYCAASSTQEMPATPTTPFGRYFSAERYSVSSAWTADMGSMTTTQIPSSTSVQTAEVQVSMPDEEKSRLRDQLTSLQGEVAKLETAMEAHRSFVAQLDTQIVEDGAVADASISFCSSDGSDGNNRLHVHVTELLRRLSDKTAALAELSAGLFGLGFGAEVEMTEKEHGGTIINQSNAMSVGRDPSEVVASLAAAFRSARLELEYLTPGEIALPLSSAGAAVLDLLLSRLRTLARQTREADDQIDEYHELERSLRQQLGARVDAMDGLVREVAERDTRISELEEATVVATVCHQTREAELEVGLDRLKGAMASYARDVAELETLVQRVEAEKEEAIAALATRAKELAEESEARQTQEAQHAQIVTSLQQAHDHALALRDACVHELREEMEHVSEALRAAEDNAEQLRIDNAAMRVQLDADQQRAQEAVATLQTELARVVDRLGQDLLPRRSGGSGGESSTSPNPASELAPPRRRLSLGWKRRSEQILDGSDPSSSDPLLKTVTVQREQFAVDVIRRRGYEENGDKESIVEGLGTTAEGRNKKRRRFDSGLCILEEADD